MQLKKEKHKVIIHRSDGLKKEVNFFVGQFAEDHSGKELILDIVNSKATFIPLEDINSGEVFFLNKGKVMFMELDERDLSDETVLSPEISVEVELTNGVKINGIIFMEMPEERSRVSDYLNFSPSFVYLCGEGKDVILNKEFVFSVRDEKHCRG